MEGRRFNNNRNSNFSSAPREMHKATCSECKQECEVPFKPTEGKGVKCRDCFNKDKPQRNNFGGRSNSFGGRNDNRRNNNFNDRPREMHKATCAGCKQECEVPFKPTEGRDVFCRDCFKNKN